MAAPYTFGFQAPLNARCVAARPRRRESLGMELVAIAALIVAAAAIWNSHVAHQRVSRLEAVVASLPEVSKRLEEVAAKRANIAAEFEAMDADERARADRRLRDEWEKYGLTPPSGRA